MLAAVKFTSLTRCYTMLYNSRRIPEKDAEESQIHFCKIWWQLQFLLNHANGGFTWIYYDLH